MEFSDFLSTVERLHQEAKDRGLFFQTASNEELGSRRWTIQGREMVSFGSCSYLGLEHDPRLIEGACDAARRYGTQFSSSRGYVSAPPYAELEDLMDQIFEAHTLVAPSTTLTHLAVFGSLLEERDAVVLDHQVHQSVHQASLLARSVGATVEMVRHESLEQALEVVERLARNHRCVWFCTDGVTSMYGDLAPFALLQRLLDLAPNVRLYVDDAHGMSWAGRYGRGSFLNRMALNERIIVATSLAKAFGVGGGVVVCASEKERDRVRMCGANLLFGGPLRPPDLGASIASAKIHLTPELVTLQEKLRSRILYTNQKLREHALPLLVENEVPIFFLPLGVPKTANEVAERMARDGVYVNVSMYPTVPMRRAGIRLAINANHAEKDIDLLTERLAEHIPAVLQEEGVSREELQHLFRRSVVSHLTGDEREQENEVHLARLILRPESDRASIEPVESLKIEHVRSIQDVPHEAWDLHMATVGTCSWSSMEVLERFYGHGEKPEHRWAFDYVTIRDQEGKVVLMTHLVTSLLKDDFTARAEVSHEVEKLRKEDPYFLTSRVLMTGSVLSEGNHLYLNREGPWKEALRKLLKLMQEIQRREKVDVLMIRDMPEADEELRSFLFEEGLQQAPMFASHLLDLGWKSEDDFWKRLKPKKRTEVRKIVAASQRYVRKTYGMVGCDHRFVGRDLRQHLHGLYKSIATRRLGLNVFLIPEELLENLLESPNWELLTLEISSEGEERTLPVAWGIAHKFGDHYMPFCCGVDEKFVHGTRDGAYRQLLWATIQRAKELGAKHLHLGMDADVEKKRFGSVIQHNCLYLQVSDHYNGAMLREVVANLGLRRERV